jgi:hypothetical protein
MCNGTKRSHKKELVVVILVVIGTVIAIRAAYL